MCGWRRMPEEIKYKFRLLNPTQYECEFTFEIPRKIFNSMFEAAKRKLKSHIEGGKLDASSIDDIEEFEILPRFYHFVGISLKLQMREVRKEVEKDGVVVLTEKVIHGKFTRKKGVGEEESSKKWVVTVVMAGVASQNKK